MPEVKIAALGTVRKLLGFSQKSCLFQGGTVAELLRQLDTVDGRDLYSNLVCEGRLRGDFAVLVNGLSIKPDALETPLQEGDQLVTMAILRHLHGG
ncbi:MAG: MoaD/ThiS family protein [Acidobacteriota bacterium]